MVRRIPEEKIDEIRQSVNIVDVINEYVQLTKQGRNFFGLCPFHGEKTPSFSVSEDKQIYHCFGCRAGGNVFSFLMEIDGLSFQEAVLKLADKANIPIDLDIKHRNKKHASLSADEIQMLEAHQLLGKFYHHILLNTKEGQDALEYLLKRGITKDIITKFQVGYATPSWDFAVKFLQKRGYPLPLLEKAGLIIKRENETEYFDRFRNRIMFPIHDQKGKIVAFSGRALDGKNPKYLNSPETPIFHKSSVLYNYYQARTSIRKKQKIILFEGYMDVLTADKANIYHAVATMGTTLTDKQVHLIRRLSHSVLICFDGDRAGKEAAFKVGTFLQENGFYVQVANLPDHLDPDDYIKKYGPDQFCTEIIENPDTFMAFKMEYYKLDKNMQNEGERLQYIEEILKEITTLRKAVERDYYLRQLAESFSLSLEALKHQQRQIYYATKNVASAKIQLQNPTEGTLQREAKLYPAHHTAERRLIAHMMRDEEAVYKIRDMLNGEQLHFDEHQAIVTYLLGFYEEGNNPNISLFLDYLPDKKLKNIVTEIEMMPLNEEKTEKELEDYVKQVLKHKKMLKIEAKLKEQKEAVRKRDRKLVEEITKEIVTLRKSL